MGHSGLDIIKRNNVHIVGDSGPVLMYAHGFGCNQKMWTRVTPAFETTHRQVLFDYVGSGQSDLSAFNVKRYSHLQGYADDIMEICDALEISSGVTLVCHSVSSSIGLLASISRPQLFQRLVLIGPNPCFLNHPPDYFGGFERTDLDDLLSLMDQNYIGWAHYLAPVVAGESLDSAVAGELSDSFCSTDPLVARTFAEATFYADNRAELPLVSRPCLILQHSKDTLAPLSVGEYLHTHLKGSTLKILEAGGHCAHISHPGLVVEAIKAYIADSASPGHETRAVWMS